MSILLSTLNGLYPRVSQPWHCCASCLFFFFLFISITVSIFIVVLRKYFFFLYFQTYLSCIFSLYITRNLLNYIVCYLQKVSCMCILKIKIQRTKWTQRGCIWGLQNNLAPWQLCFHTWERRKSRKMREWHLK